MGISSFQNDELGNEKIDIKIISQCKIIKYEDIRDLFT
jgi:hypothetical protein